ncbi:MAG: DUF4426 domain-containing protein [Rhizobium sp.]|nr:MAG: DUF4426 domain-containing protein [Rhizobium sp.]
MKRALLALGLLLLSAGASAQQLVRDGNVVVHYAAMSTLDLSPEMARQYGIRQGSKRGMLLLNLQREAAGKSVPLRGSATGTARNLMGDVQTLTLRPAGGDSTQDLIAEFDISHLEFLTFDIDVKPEGSARPLKIKFQQQFFSDEN